jgi:hypothetical protein
MDSNIILIALTVIPILIIGGFLGIVFDRRQRTKKLQQKFGPEYELALQELGNKHQAEQELTARIDRVKALDIRPLSPEETKIFTSKWQAAQIEFVDEPLNAVQNADQLINQVMTAKGYPVKDFEQQAADISVDYPSLVTDYRGLHKIAVTEWDEDVSTEEMRQAMIHGRNLFEKLMNQDEYDERMDERDEYEDVEEMEKSR